MVQLFKLIRDFFYFFFDLYINRRLIISLAVQDFRQKYLGNYLGIVWAFTGPLMTVVIMWFVFQIGFKSKPVEGMPFILWLIAGLFPWFFLTEAILSGANSITDKPYLVKKIVFKVSTLPVIKLLIAVFIHIFFVLMMILIFLFYGISPTLSWLQIIYYMFAAMAFVLGLSWAISSLVVFIRDISQFIGVFIQFGFWLTPVFWSPDMIPENYKIFIKLNPAYYIIEGYRDSMIKGIWFWEKPVLTIYFWSVTIVMMIFGAYFFKKLRPHFADVL